MARTLTDKEVKLAQGVVDSVIEPELKRAVETLNEVLAKHDMRAGLEVQWFFEGISDPLTATKEPKEPAK